VEISLPVCGGQTLRVCSGGGVGGFTGKVKTIPTGGIMANATVKQVRFIAALDAKVRAADWLWLSADDAVFGPGTYGRHLQRKWADGGLCVKGASDLIGLYKRALQEVEENARHDHMGSFEVGARERVEG
jgi:hypothetical protein